MMLSPAEHDALNGGVPPVLARTTQSRKTHSARCTTKEEKRKDGDHNKNRTLQRCGYQSTQDPHLRSRIKEARRSSRKLEKAPACLSAAPDRHSPSCPPTHGHWTGFLPFIPRNSNAADGSLRAHKTQIFVFDQKYKKLLIF